MKRHEYKIIDEIVDLWLAFELTTREQESIAQESPTVMQKMVDHHGELPESSAYKPEVITGKVDRMRRIFIAAEEKRAHAALFSLPENQRILAALWPQMRKNRNPATGNRFTQEDIARVFGLTLEVYLTNREAACDALLSLWRKRLVA